MVLHQPMSMLQRVDRAVEHVCEMLFPPAKAPLVGSSSNLEGGGSAWQMPHTSAVCRSVAPKLVVLDVDVTILLPSTPLATVPDTIRSVAHGQSMFVDSSFLAQFCTALRARDHLLGLATFCEPQRSFFSMTPHAADQLVELLDTTLPFCRDYLRDDTFIVCGSPHRRCVFKNEHLQQLVQRVEATAQIAVDHGSVVLIDDCAENVAAARAAGYSAFCCGDGGLSRAWFARSYQLQDTLGVTAEEIAAVKPVRPAELHFAPTATSRLPRALSSVIF